MNLVLQYRTEGRQGAGLMIKYKFTPRFPQDKKHHYPRAIAKAHKKQHKQERGYHQRTLPASEPFHEEATCEDSQTNSKPTPITPGKPAVPENMPNCVLPRPGWARLDEYYSLKQNTLHFKN